MDRLASFSSLPTSRKRARSSSLSKDSQQKRPRVEDWIEDTIASQSSSGRGYSRKARSDSEVELSTALERQESAKLSERPRLTTEVLGPTASNISPTASDISPTASDILLNSEMSSVGPDSAAYESELQKRRIFFAEGMEVRNPENLNEILQITNKARGSPGPDEEDIEAFPDIATRTGNEPGVFQALWPLIMPKLKKFWNSKRDSPLVNMPWSTLVQLQRSLTPTIPPPQPDQAFAFRPQVFHEWPKATQHLGSHMTPALNVVWPYFTVEAKGKGGTVNVAMLQNAHNGAVMLNNMFKLKLAIGQGDDFFGKIWVMSMWVTVDSVQLNGHFMTKNAKTNDYEYWSKRLHSVGVGDDMALAKAYRWCVNSIYHLRDETERWIKTDLETLETMLKQGLVKKRPSITLNMNSASASRRRSASPR